jgi:hypothetical protein
MTSPLAGQRSVPKVAPKVALVQLDAPATETLTRAFAQCGIQTVQVAEDFATRLGREQFQGCMVRLDEHAPTILEAVRSSRSNHRIILYGILTQDTDVCRFSKYGINVLLDSRLDRNAVLKVARSTSALLLNELRRYVRIPLVVEVSVESRNGTLSGSTREISGGGMSVQLTGHAQISSDNARLTFSLPDKPTATIGASSCWQKDSLVGFQFESSDPARRIVKDWISSFLGLD